MSKTFDAIVIGSGQAGPFLAKRLAAAGRTVALIERNVLGGTCVNTGCTPTKAMVACAIVAHTAREAARFGVHVETNIRVSLAEVKSRADRSFRTRGRVYARCWPVPVALWFTAMRDWFPPRNTRGRGDPSWRADLYQRRFPCCDSGAAWTAGSELSHKFFITGIDRVAGTPRRGRRRGRWC